MDFLQQLDGALKCLAQTILHIEDSLVCRAAQIKFLGSSFKHKWHDRRDWETVRACLGLATQTAVRFWLPTKLGAPHSATHFKAPHNTLPHGLAPLHCTGRVLRNGGSEAELQRHHRCTVARCRGCEVDAGLTRGPTTRLTVYGARETSGSLLFARVCFPQLDVSASVLQLAHRGLVG